MLCLRLAIAFAALCIGLNCLYGLFWKLPPLMNGTSSFEFRSVVQEYKKLIQSGADLGSSFSVYHGSANVVNVHGGYSDVRFLLPWTPNTLSQTFTLSLISIPLTFAMLRDRSLLDLTETFATIFPTVSAANVTIGDLLAHRSGFPYFVEHISLALWRDDYKTVIESASHQLPSIQPKLRMMHIHSLALLADYIVRKTDPRGRTLGHFFMEEIAWPLGLDILVGLPRSQLYRVARTYHADWFTILNAVIRFDFGYLWTNIRTNKWMPYGGNRERVLNSFTDYELLYNMNPDLLELPLASSHMFTNARSLSRLVQVLLPNHPTTSANETLFSAETLSWLLHPYDEQAFDDPVLQRPLALTTSGLIISQSPQGNPIYGMWDDIMGQMVFVDPKHQLALAYVTNHAHGRSLSQDTVLSSLTQAVYRCLKR